MGVDQILGLSVLGATLCAAFIVTLRWFATKRVHKLSTELSTARIELLEGRVEVALTHLARLEKRYDASTPAVLRADLDDLRTAVDIDRKALRKSLGKIWGTLGHERDAAPGAGGTISDDEEFNALIALQRQHGSS